MLFLLGSLCPSRDFAPPETGDVTCFPRQDLTTRPRPSSSDEVSRFDESSFETLENAVLTCTPRMMGDGGCKFFLVSTPCGRGATPPKPAIPAIAAACCCAATALACAKETPIPGSNPGRYAQVPGAYAAPPGEAYALIGYGLCECVPLYMPWYPNSGDPIGWNPGWG